MNWRHADFAYVERRHVPGGRPSSTVCFDPFATAITRVMASLAEGIGAKLIAILHPHTAAGRRGRTPTREQRAAEGQAYGVAFTNRMQHMRHFDGLGCSGVRRAEDGSAVMPAIGIGPWLRREGGDGAGLRLRAL